jgi:hypothetical protein
MQGLVDRVENSVRVGEDVAIPEPQAPKTEGSQERVPMQVLRRPLDVLTTVKFNNEPGLETNEVADIDADGMLTPELVAIDLAATQATPKASFSLSKVFAKVAGEVNHPCRASHNVCYP